MQTAHSTYLPRIKRFAENYRETRTVIAESEVDPKSPRGIPFPAGFYLPVWALHCALRGKSTRKARHKPFVC
jgi:hypothetical protein